MLDIIVVGGGIAGLSAAISLRRVGHAVRVYERSAFNNEIGAAIMVCPNASRPLLAWGLDPVRAKFVTCRSTFHAAGSTMEKFRSSNLENIEYQYGSPWFLAHRVDLHEELKRLATEPHGLGQPAVVHLRSQVIKYDPETARVTLNTGDVASGDLVIAADGIHSIGVETILGQANPALPQEQHNFCYRFLIPTAAILGDPVTRFWAEDDDGRVKFLVDDSKRLVSYPCRNNEEQNFVAIFHSDDITSMQKEDWQASVDKSKLLQLFSDFHPTVSALLEKATDVKQWALLYRAPIPAWSKGRMVLVGDAAHPMLPHQGQGGSQSIEDGAAIGVVLAGAERVDIPARLKIFEAIRKNRASVITICSNAGQDEAERIQKDAAKFMAPESVPKNPEEFFQFNFGYDIVQDSVEKMKTLHPDFALPAGYLDASYLDRKPSQEPTTA